MENSNNTGKVIGAVVIGALVGAALGILFAPDKGSKTRAKLIGGAKDLADDFQEKMKEEIAALRDKATELEKLAENKMNDLASDLKHKAENL